MQIGDPALADLTLNGVQFNVSSPALPAIPANAASSPYGTTLFAQVANGSSSVQLSQNMPIATASGADTSVEMGDMSTNSTVTISVSGRVGPFRHICSLYYYWSLCCSVYEALAHVQLVVLSAARPRMTSSLMLFV